MSIDNPICNMLPNAIKAGKSQMSRGISTQKAAKSQADGILNSINLSDVLEGIPDLDFTLNTEAINAIKNSCPGQFPDLPSINNQFSLGYGDYLKDLRASPIGQLDNIAKSLESFMKKISSIPDKLYNYLTCLRAICSLSPEEFQTEWDEITSLKNQLDLDENGSPKILSESIKGTLDNYNTKVSKITKQIKKFT